MPPRIGLALSGGGFRATLFHLGVVRLLNETGLLSQVKRIGAVSGGSILAAHLVLNWEQYAGRNEDFDKAAKKIIQFVQKDIRGRVIRRWILAWICLALPQLVM
jgi:predicted acylesterase/phospholipase RssA